MRVVASRFAPTGMFFARGPDMTVGSWQVRTVTALRCSVRTSVLHAEHGGAVDTLRPHRDVSCCHGDHAKSLSRGQSSSRGIRARAHSRIGSPNSWLCKP